MSSEGSGDTFMRRDSTTPCLSETPASEHETSTIMVLDWQLDVQFDMNDMCAEPKANSPNSSDKTGNSKNSSNHNGRRSTNTKQKQEQQE